MKQPTSMIEKVEDYLECRQGMGYQLHTEAGQLRRFARYVDDSDHHGPLTTEVALRWARSGRDNTRLYWTYPDLVDTKFSRFLG